MGKGEPTSVSGSEKTGSSSLRRTTRGTNLREQLTSTSLAKETPPENKSNSIPYNTRKSKSEKKEITPSVKRKSEVLEKEKISSAPLRRSARGKNLTSLADVKKRKIRIETSVEASKAEKQVRRPNGRIKKKMNGHTYKVQFTRGKRKHTSSDMKEDMERPEKLHRTSLGNVSNPLDDESDGAEECTEKIEEEHVERDCGGKGQSVFEENRRMDNSMEVIDEHPQKIVLNVLSGGIIIEENIDDYKKLNVDHDLVVELQILEEGIPESSFAEETDLDEDLEIPDKMFQSDFTSFGIDISKPTEDESERAEECIDKFEEEFVEREYGGKDQSISKANNDDALVVELQTPEKENLPDRDAVKGTGVVSLSSSECEEDNNGNALVVELQTPEKENLPDRDAVKRTGVVSLPSSECEEDNNDNALVVELQTPENENLPDRDAVKRTGVVSLPSSECEEDNNAGTCALCGKMSRLNYNSPHQDLCFCSIAPSNDLLKASQTQDKVELAQCDDSLNDALNDGNWSTCAICKLDENLMCCDGIGCKQKFHLSCLDMPLDDGLPGSFHCLSCVEKKIKLGVRSVSQGIEEIWDAREVEIQDDTGLQKLFFVKFIGVSHIHNQWLPKSRLLLESSILISDFDKQKSMWNKDWIKPRRIIKKRLLWSPKHCDNDAKNCQYEWLIKWRGLDYEHATWELENASFFNDPKFKSLLEEFDNRHHRAKEVPSSSADKIEKQNIVQLPTLATGCTFGDDHNQQTVDKLFRFWSKGNNAIVIGDQKRFANLVSLITSLVSHVTQPFLVISSPSALCLWEAEFSRLAPSINVVIYSGNQNNRKIIRNSEFYADRDCTMLQVLLSSVDAVIEDVEVILPRWEAIIIDECQDCEISKYFEQISALKTFSKILLFNGQLKESTAEHLNLLSLLDTPENLISVSSSKCCELRERLSPFIAYEYWPDSSKFIEYWVPVPTSNVQLEQYCATLVSNSATLRSSSAKDIVGALHDILLSTKKCCDHPYLADSGLQEFLTKDLPPHNYLDVGIKASGKLQLLDTILSEIKSRGKRVLVIFQSIRSAGISTGDILDDFLRQKFGIDSYERADVGMPVLKKQEAINKFNDKSSGRFVFLLEKRGCSSTMKLGSIDAAVIFDSDWNIMSDIRALHRLSIDSYTEPIKIFRLFTSGTLEEKVLDLATNHVNFDSNLKNIGRTTVHMLLMWGASNLFRKLDEFHVSNSSKNKADLFSDVSMLNDVAGELLVLIHNAKHRSKHYIITNVRQNGVTYSKNVPLFGHLKGQSNDGKVAQLFWKELLECKNPLWRFLPVNSPRNRKRVRYFDELTKEPHAEFTDITKKQKKVVDSCADVVSSRTGRGEAFEVPIPYSEEEINLCVSQKNLRAILMPAISKLSNVLQISEDMKTVGGMFLEYIVDHHQISSESESLLQALQISLIWIAGKLLKRKLDKKQSLSVAKQQLGFGCTEKQVKDVYDKLRLLKTTFKERSQKFKEMFSRKDILKDHLNQIPGKCKILKIEHRVEPEKEIQEFNRIWEEQREQIEDDHRAELEVIRAMYSFDSAIRLDKLKNVDDVFVKKLNEHKRDKDLQLEELKRKHLDERTNKNPRADSWSNHVKENVVPLSGEKTCLNMIEKIEVAVSTNSTTTVDDNEVFDATLEIPALPLHSLCQSGTMEKQLGNLCSSSNNYGNDTAGDNRLSVAEQTLDEKAINDLYGVVKCSDICKQSKEFNNDSNQRSKIDFIDTESIKNGVSEANGSKHDGSFTDTPLLLSHSVQILEPPPQDVALPQNLALQDESTMPSTSAETLLCNAPNCENTNPSERAESTAHNNNNVQSYENANIIEQRWVQPVSSTSVQTSILDSHANEIYNVNNSELYGPLPQLLPQNRKQSNFQIGENLLPSVSTRVVDENLDNDGTQMGTSTAAYTPSLGFWTTYLSRRAQYMDLSAQTQPLQDPLQIEYERVCKYTDEANKLHEHAALQDESTMPSTSAETLLCNAPNCENTNPSERAELTAHNNNNVQSYENANIIEQRWVQPVSSTSVQTSILDSHANEIYNVNNPELYGPLPQLLPQNRKQSNFQIGENLLPSVSARVVDENLDNDGTQMGTSTAAYTPSLGFWTTYLSRRAQYMDLSAQTQPLQDPLQIEYERVCKETDEANKLHEHAKLQVKSDYDKELTEVHRKYEARCKDVEAEYQSKLKKRDAYNQKVHMNKILAEVFHTYFLERRPSSPGMCQGPSTNFQQQYLLPLSQPQRTVSGVPNVVRPKSNPRNPVQPVSAPPCSAQIIACTQMRRNSTLPNTCRIGNIPVPPAVGQQNAVPSVPAPPRSPPVIGSFQMNQSRTFPNIRSFGNLPVSRPPPHLRPSSMSASSIPPASHGLPRRQLLTQPPSQPIYHNRLPHPVNMEFQHPSVSSVGLCNIESLPGLRPPKVLPREPASYSDLVEQYLSQERMQGDDRIGKGDT